MTKLLQAPVLLFVTTLLLLVIWDTIQVNTVVFLTLRRGIISQNCFWWSVNDFFPDPTGALVYQKLKQRGRFVDLNIFGKQVILLTELCDIKKLLDLSPNPFGPGEIKKNFFTTFMPNNIGISTNPEWKYKRQFNDIVLQSDTYHHQNVIYNESIKEIFSILLPKNFDEFTEAARTLTSKIIFGTYEYNSIIYKIFKQADSFLSARFTINTVNQTDLQEFHSYLHDELLNPKPNTLLSIANQYHKMLPMNVIIDQIPHWVFPIAGLFSVHLPRLIAILANHPKELENVISDIKTLNYYSNKSYIRKCILELFRLNNAVNSTFRGLTEPFQFDDSQEIFDTSTQFVFFNNPVLRDLFDKPNQFIPSRWNENEEHMYRALMFNQANQRCPGKELTISLLTLGLVNYIELNNYTLKTNLKISQEFVPFIINPCKLTFE